MKAIIRGKRFDTDKAELIGGAEGGGSSRTDWHYWEESLYRTPTSKQYFIAGSGGPLSAWGQRIGQNERRGSSGIKPLSAAEALDWAQQNLPADLVEEAFGDQIEDAWPCSQSY